MNTKDLDLLKINSLKIPESLKEQMRVNLDISPEMKDLDNKNSKTIITPFTNDNYSKRDLVNSYLAITDQVLGLTNKSDLHEFESLIQSMDIKTKGFINTTSGKSIPLIGDLWKLFEIDRFLKENDLKLTEGVNRFIIHNFYYFITIAILHRLVNKLVYLNNTNSTDDLKADFSVLLQEYLRKIDPRIRKYLRGSRINIIDKVYVGFDTEYESKDHKENTLLSTQLSVTGTIIIRVNNEDKGFDFTKSILPDGMIVRNMSYKTLLERLPILETTNILIKDVIGELRDYMENSVNNKFINRLESLCARKLIYKTSETSEMTEYTVPLKEVNDLPEFINYFKYHEAGVAHPSMTDMVDKSIDLTKDIIDGRYAYFKDLLNEKSVNIIDNPVNKDLIESNNSDISLIDSKSDNEVSLNIKETKFYNYINQNNAINPFTPDNKHPNSLSLITTGLNGALRGEHRRGKYIIFACHFSIADLSMLSDFNEIKNNFDSIQNTLVTISKPYLMEKGKTVVLRDTMLLAPAGASSLDQIGVLYGLPKIDIGDYITRMSDLRNDDSDLFMRYALRDTEITLRHIIEMEKASFLITGIGSVPTTLSSLARRFVFKHWDDKGIDLNNFIYYGNYKISDFNSIYTPKGLQTTGNIGLYLPLFMGGFRGGRNESYAYGSNYNDIWYDYDLTSAYTTAMSHLGIPNFNNAKYIVGKNSFKDFIKHCVNPNDSELDSNGKWIRDYNTLYNCYSVFHVKFKFPENTIYPCLPVSIDESSALYPLNGETIVTGYEIYLASLMKCEMNLIRGVVVPFKMGNMGERPYLDVIKYLQEERNKHPKFSLYNLLYKQLGNSIYGQTGQGLGSIKRLNTRTNTLEDIGTSLLSNPLISSHITGLLRSVLGEVIRQVELKGGRIISSTTDGLITDIEGLDSKLDYDSKLLSIYSNLRKTLSGDSTMLEIKHAVKGIFSWATRGQLGIEPLMNPLTNKLYKNISAMTGFQPRNYEHQERIRLIKEAFESDYRRINFGQRSLRKVTDIFKDGGHVTAKVNERSFRVVYDNRRQIIDTGLLPSTNLLFSKPLLDRDTAATLKAIGLLGSDLYAPNTEYSLKSGSSDYKDIAIRSFIRALLQNKLNLVNTFSNYNEIIEFIYTTFDIKLNPNYIANQKRRAFIPNMVPSNKQTLEIIDKIKIKFPEFNVKLFLQN